MRLASRRSSSDGGDDVPCALTLVRPSFYQDSVALLALAGASRRPDVAEAAALMATPANRELLAHAGLLTTEAAAAGPNDLVVVIECGACRGPPPASAAEELSRRVARGESPAGATRPVPSTARCAGCPTPTSR